MNICFLSKEYPPETHVGGIGTYTYNMAAALSKMGHQIHVISATSASDQTINDNGVWVHRIKRRNIIPYELCFLEYSHSVSKKISQIDCSFDIVHASEFGGEAFWFCLYNRIPLVTRLATPFYLTERLNGRSIFGPRPFLNWMEKKQTIKSNGIFTSTKALANEVCQEWHIEPSRVKVIPNSVDIERVVKFADRNTFPDILKETDYLLYFGRLEERKGVRVLAEALPDIFKHVPNIRMVFVGADMKHQGSTMRGVITEHCSAYNDRIIFFDNLPHEELFPIVKQARIVLLPSLWEAFGFVCVEALALGRPVVATSGSGFDEIIVPGKSGFLIEPGNCDALSKEVITLLENKTKLMKISEEAISRAKDFEVSNIAKQLMSYYNKIAHKKLKTEGASTKENGE